MAEEQRELSHEELRDSTYDVMANALQEINDERGEDQEPVVETKKPEAEPETKVEATGETIDGESTNLNAPTYQEAQDSQQESRNEEFNTEATKEAVQTREAGEEGVALESEDSEVLDNLKPKAQERFKYWIDRAKNIENQYNQMLSGNTQLVDIIQTSTTNPQQLGWALELFKGLNSGNYGTAINALKGLDQFSDQIAKKLGVHSDGNEKSTYEDFEDLSGAVQNLEMSEDWANKLASQRTSQNSMNQAQASFREQQQQHAQYSHQLESHKQHAFNQIEAWEQDLTEKDPDFGLKKDIMIEMGTQLAQSQVPPDQWLPVLQNQYQTLSRGMSVASPGKGSARKRSGPLAPGTGNSGSGNVKDLESAEVTPEFLRAHLDAMHGN